MNSMTRLFVASIVTLVSLAVGCGSGDSPTAPSTVAPGPSLFDQTLLSAVAPGGEFTLDVTPALGRTLQGDAWLGYITIWPNTYIVSPRLPSKVTLTCGDARRLSLHGFWGDWFFSCQFPVGRHVVQVVAEIASGASISASTIAEVGYDLPVDGIVVLNYLITLSSGEGWVDVYLSTATLPTATRHEWDFGDECLQSDGRTTLRPATSCRYVSRGIERQVSVRVIGERERVLATGRALGKW